MDKEQPAPDMMDVVHLRNGDVVPCRVESITETHLQVAPVFAQAGRIGRQKVKAIEFNSDQYPTISGFDDPGWVIQEQQKGAVRRAEDQIVFSGTATLSHPELLQGNEFQFDVQWGPGETPTVMTFGLFTQDIKRVSSQHHLIVYFLRDQLYLQGRVDGQQALHVMRPMQLANRHASIRLALTDDHLEVFVDKNRAIRQRYTRKDRTGKGLVLQVQQSGNRRGVVNPRNRLVTVSKLRVGPSAGLSGGRDIDDEKKQLALTVPRSRKKNPPTHVLVAQNGDLLRGGLLGMSDGKIQFRSRMDEVTLPRDRLSAVIWLDDEQQVQSEPVPIGKHNLQAILRSGAKFSFNADKIEDGHLVGLHPHFGACRLPLSAVREIHTGSFEESQQALAYSSWKLQPAKEPQFAGGTPGDGTEFGLDSPLVGSVAQDFQTKLADGTKFRLSDQAGKIVILDFWATWCGPCVRAMPQIIETVSAFPDDQVVLIAVNQQESVKVIEDFLKARELNVTAALDPDGDIGRLFQVEAIPQTVIIGRDGKIERLHVGAHPNMQEVLSEALQALLNPAAPPVTDESAAG